MEKQKRMDSSAALEAQQSSANRKVGGLIPAHVVCRAVVKNWDAPSGSSNQDSDHTRALRQPWIPVLHSPSQPQHKKKVLNWFKPYVKDRGYFFK